MLRRSVRAAIRPERTLVVILVVIPVVTVAAAEIDS